MNRVAKKRDDTVSFLQLKRLAQKNTEGLYSYKLAVLGEFATQHFCLALKGYAIKQGIALDIFEADYNQIDAQLSDPASVLYSFKPHAVLIGICTEVLFERYCTLPLSQRGSLADQCVEQFKHRWEAIASNLGSVILQLNYAEQDDRIWGDYACKKQESFLFQTRKLNMLLMEAATKNTSVHIVDIAHCQNQMGYDIFCDVKQYLLSKMPFSLDGTVRMASKVVDVIKALSGKIVKCVVLDLDGTLWGGVIGDDGLEGIQLGNLGAGEAYVAFQRWLKLLNERGILLAVCSKNEPAAAKLPFEKHPDMVLKLEDFSAFVANWENKAGNISNIQKTLNIGMDSIVFIDDNPFERNAVRELLPDCIVPEMPEDVAMFVPYLRSLNLFEMASFSEEDAHRARQYQTEAKRAALRTQFDTYDEYLESLAMRAEAKSFDSFAYPRIAQLSQRTNQFNLRTMRYTEREIADIATNTKYESLYFTLDDKMGAYGIICAVILEKRRNLLFIDTWFMSCRVLKRGMEEYVMNKIVERARQLGYETVLGEYIPTQKNPMVKDLYAQFGFIQHPDGLFYLNVRDYSMRAVHIKEA